MLAISSLDLSTFGKGMANGFSVSALCGTRELMDLGGIYHDRERVFLLSTTSWRGVAFTGSAHIASIKVYEEQENVCDTLSCNGEKLQQRRHHRAGNWASSITGM